MGSEVVRAPAKLTLSLRVTGVRADGYHTIDAEMVSLDLHDEIEIIPGGTDVRITGGFVTVDLDPADNLVTKAAELSGRQIGANITKRIPAGAGLGGGSADAAAVLRWANFTDLVAAASIGADVAFCLIGGRARVSGIGEIVDPMPFLAQSFTVVTPPIHCSTPEVYAMWDRLGGPEGSEGNDLEPAALRVAPDLAEVRDSLGDATGWHSTARWEWFVMVRRWRISTSWPRRPDGSGSRGPDCFLIVATNPATEGRGERRQAVSSNSLWDHLLRSVASACARRSTRRC